MKQIAICFLLLGISNILYSQSKAKTHFSVQQNFHDFGRSLFEKKKRDTKTTQSIRLGYNRSFFKVCILSIGVAKGELLTYELEPKTFQETNTIGMDATLVFMRNSKNKGKRYLSMSPTFSFGYHYNRHKFGLTKQVYSVQYTVGADLEIKNRTNIFLKGALNQQLSGNFTTHLVYSLGISRGIILAKHTSLKANQSKEEILKILDQKFVAQMDQLTDSSDFNITKTQQRIDTLEIVLGHLKAELNKLNQDIFTLTKFINKSDSGANRILNIEQSTRLIVPIDLKGIAAHNTVFFEGHTEQIHGYYVVILSVRDKSLALAEAQKIHKIYPNVKILSAPNGYFRTAIYAGKDKIEAKMLIEEGAKDGLSNAWIVYY